MQAERAGPAPDTAQHAARHQVSVSTTDWRAPRFRERTDGFYVCSHGEPLEWVKNVSLQLHDGKFGIQGFRSIRVKIVLLLSGSPFRLSHLT